jgi:hypothetical protein
MVVLNAFLALAAASTLVLAHPGHDVKQEIAQRSAYMAQAEYRSLAHCSAKFKERGVQERAIARRKAHVEALRTKRSIEKRDFNTVLNTNHHSDKNYTLATPADVLFAGNNSCILSPEVTEGPYCEWHNLRCINCEANLCRCLWRAHSPRCDRDRARRSSYIRGPSG